MASTESTKQWSRILVVLCLTAWVVSYFIYTALRGEQSNSSILHVPYVMWAAFMIPAGWAGLGLMLSQGPRRGIAAALMFALGISGVLSTIECFRYDLRHPYAGPKFSLEEVDELRDTCRGETVGYFAKENQAERVWWLPRLSSWAVLADCKFVRMNKLEMDKSGYTAIFWYWSAPGAYARSEGLEWTNSPAIVLNFAVAHGIQFIAEWPEHPIPSDIRFRLQPVRQAGPFMLYRVASAP